RDALIALAGLLLVRGKFDAAKAMLLNLAARVRRGILPTEFSENAIDCSYDGADTSLWFIHALWQYHRYTGDDATARKLLGTVHEIIDRYRDGAARIVHADDAGLLVARSDGRPASWMNAKTGDHLITPRDGRPVELNALWYNAVRIAADWSDRFGQAAPGKKLARYAATIASAFNARFWNADARCCYDVLDEQARDAAIRPSQLLALSLPFPALAAERHIPAIETIRRELLTPVGLRTLSPKDHAYQGRYVGDALSRDRAMHQGCVH